MELAGGKRVRLDDDDDGVDDSDDKKEKLPVPSTFSLPTHKVKMMERFLWGDESVDASVNESWGLSNCETSAAALDAAAKRKGRPLTEEEEFLEKQFDKVVITNLL